MKHIIQYEQFIVKESYYDDLTPYEYGRPGINKVNIGWLDIGKDYPKGEVSKELIEKIKLAPTQERYKGFHLCPFCDKNKGRPASCTSNQQVEGNGKIYVFPQLLAHYIESHQYLPPKEFLDAVDKMQVEKKEISRSGPISRFK